MYTVITPMCVREVGLSNQFRGFVRPSSICLLSVQWGENCDIQLFFSAEQSRGTRLAVHRGELGNKASCAQGRAREQG